MGQFGPWSVLIELEGPGGFELDADTFTRLFDVLYGRHGAQFYGSQNRITVRLTVEPDPAVTTTEDAAKRASRIVQESMVVVGLGPWTVTTLEAEPIEELELKSC